MAQTTQIVPKYRFPSVETYINNYTVVSDTATTDVDGSIKQLYVGTSSKGVDNVFIKKTNRQGMVNTFGESNFAKYGQPYMQALNVVDQDNSQVWFMRVMPENALRSNIIVKASYKIDGTETEASKRKYRVKLTPKEVESVNAASDLISVMDDDNASPLIDAEGYTPYDIIGAYSGGRGTYGDLLSFRIAQNIDYEKDYGIKLYQFEVLNSEAGLTNEATDYGCLVTSDKYSTEMSTLIDDILNDKTVGEVPTYFTSREDAIAIMYNAYIEFAKALHDDLVTEYDAKVIEYNIPEDMLNHVVEPTEEYLPLCQELWAIEEEIEDTETDNLPDLDGFDPLFGHKVGSTEMLPAFVIEQTESGDVDPTAEGYDPRDYTTDEVVNLSSSRGIKLLHGSNGYFDDPRTVIDDSGATVKWTVEDEVNYCYKQAFSGVYDKRILSSRRLPVSVFFDASYADDVKEQLYEIVVARNSACLYLDVVSISSLGRSEITTLARKYRYANTYISSLNINRYLTREPSTNKKVDVSINYFESANYVQHVTLYGVHVPRVFSYAQLSGHIKDSLYPIVEEYDSDVKDALVDNRFNYYETIEENVFQKGVQNTRDLANSDLLEISNAEIVFEMKGIIEKDANSMLYNFADEYIRQNFIEAERAKFAGWIGTKVQSFDITFGVSKYEFEHSILHLYLDVVLRGIYKHVLVEIDLNKRTYVASTEEA